MPQDQQTYERAANAALVGLLIQLTLSVLLALLGLYAEAPALHAATWHFFGGLPIWGILWVLFNQHRLERVEALEAEELARADARSAGIFDEAGEQLRHARGLLGNIYRYWLNIVSLLVAVYLLVLGGLWFWYAYVGLKPLPKQVAAPVRVDPLGPPVTPAIELQEPVVWIEADANAGVLATLLVIIAFVAFLAARYVAGMTRVPQWELLRGGASYLMGNVVITVLSLVAAGIVWLGNETLFAVMAVVIPAIMLVLGVEILLSFVLGIYRPRRPGQMVRPAFDSRLMGWLTRPEAIGKIIGEAINYQFGLEISRSWFYQLLGRAIAPLIIIGAVVLVALSSIVIVDPHENAVITNRGKLEGVVGPGLAFKWPWPIGRAEKYGVYRVHEIVTGSGGGRIKPDVAILWTNSHVEGEELYLLTAPAPFHEASEGGEVVAGEFIGADLTIKYRIDDLEQYVNSAVEPEAILQAVAERCLNAYVVTKDVDTLLSEGREMAGEVLREQIQAQADSFGLGIEVVFAGLTGVHPPQRSEVAAKFHEQIGSVLEKQTKIEQARKQAISTLAKVAGSSQKAMAVDEAIHQIEALKQQLNDLRRADEYDPESARLLEVQILEQEVTIEKLMDAAGGEAAQLIYEARAYRWEHALSERAHAMWIRSQSSAFQQAPRIFRARLILETLAEGLKDRRKVILTGQEPATIRVQLEEQTADLTTLIPAEQ